MRHNGIGTPGKGMPVHIPVGSRIVPVHQSRFGGGVHFPLEALAQGVLHPVHEEIPQHPMHVPHQYRHTVLPAPGTGLGRHVVETAQPVLSLYGAGDFLDGQGVPVQHIIFFIAGFPVNGFLEQDGDPGFLQGFFQPTDPFQESQMDQDGRLHRSRDVLGEEQQGTMIPFQELFLGCRPAVPGQEHVRHFHSRACQTDYRFFHNGLYSFLVFPRVRISSMKARA